MLALSGAPSAVESLPSPQFCFQLRPLGYARLVHPRAPGAVLFGAHMASKTKKKDDSPSFGWQDRRWSPGALASRAVDLGRFKFMGFATYPFHKPGEPKPEKVEANCISIGACWVDLDFHDHDDWKHLPPAVVLEAVRNTCAERGWPSPSYATHSGRGLLVVWLYPVQPAQTVMARHKAVQQVLHEGFRHMGSDPSARTMTKQFRMPRTVNEKSGVPVSIIWPAMVREIERTTFDELCRTVLPFKRLTTKEREAKEDAAKAKRTAARLAARTPRDGHYGARLTGTSYWCTIRADLEKLLAFRHGQKGVIDGKSRSEFGAGRNAWLTSLVYAAAWDMTPEELDAYVIECADRLGYEHAETKSKTCSIVQRAKQAARGLRRTFKGRPVDPRYKLSPARFIETLAITPREMRRADLRILVDEARRSENAVARVVASRRAKGVKARSSQQDLRRQVGEQALEMVAEGMTVKRAAELYGASPRWMDKALRDARAVAGIGSVRKERPAFMPESETTIDQPLLVVDDVANTLDTIPQATHEVLRGIRLDAVDGVVAGAVVTYSAAVTTKGSTLLRPAPAARQLARRALSCPDLVGVGA
ncbi:hypothetical protein ASG51_21195 [Methylobacterium sp. Leaf465]|nr:hypothetical protein ASG51_21195 [Methylobacterium sp. Leaf465]